MDKQWYVHTMEYYSAIKRNELLMYEKTWRKLKRILLSERSQPGKATYCVTPAIRRSGKCKTKETVKRSVAARGLRGRDELAEHRGFLG